ncbi:hypothetical protein FRB90_005683 [Tulasnella sp. 427]|nr:hypothetical protein FRB90_005683 [Tulasnella sp. 427]
MALCPPLSSIAKRHCTAGTSVATVYDSHLTMASKEEQDFFRDCKGRNAGSSISLTTAAVEGLEIRETVTARAPLDEAHNDFYGLPSNPLSIYHTSPSWPLPEAQRVPKEARPVCTHAISSVWHELGEKIYKFFGSIELKWTSIDPVRFAEVEQEPGHLFLWVGVLPGTLSAGRAKRPAARCKELLSEYGITDVEIAFRESIYTQYAGPQLLDRVLSIDPTVDVRVPFTPAIGLQIAPKAYPSFDGTGCLYSAKAYSNELYHRMDNSIPRREVIHTGAGALRSALKAIMDEIGHWDEMVESYEEELTGRAEHVEGGDSTRASHREVIGRKLEEATASRASVFEFHRNITSAWSAESQRILGHVVYALPISVGDRKCTEDWALVELDRTKFDWDTFRGNVVHLGTS